MERVGQQAETVEAPVRQKGTALSRGASEGRGARAPGAATPEQLLPLTSLSCEPSLSSPV